MGASWEVPLGIVLTIFGGICLAVQAGVNASLGAHATKPLAAIISFGMGLVACCLYMLIDATAISKQLPSAADMQAAPWWAWIGGVLGAYYVIVNISFAYKLGAGTAVSVFVCSQLGCSIVLDLAGLVGFQKRAFSWPRITGAALMIMGVILVTQFPGAVITPKQPPPPPAADPEAQQQQQQQQQQQATAAAKKASPDQLQAASGGSSLIPAAAPSLRNSSIATSRSRSGLGGDNSSSSSSSVGSSVQLAASGSGGGSGAGGSRRLRGVVAGLQDARQQSQQPHWRRSDVDATVLHP